MTSFNLQTLGPAARTLVFWFTIALILGFGVAVLMLHNSYKFDSAEVIRHYRGSDDVNDSEDPRSYGGMVMVSHAHALSVPLTYAALAFLFLGTAVSERAKKWLITGLFLTFFAEWSSLWGLRYLSGTFVYLAGGAGILSSVIYLFMCGRILYDLRSRTAQE